MDHDILYSCNQCDISFCEIHFNTHTHQPNSAFNISNTSKIDFKSVANSIFNNYTNNPNITKNRNKYYETYLRQNPKVLTTGKETLDLLLGITLIAWVFGFQPLLLGTQQWPYILVLTLIISPAFILHELAHKYAAIAYGRYARFALDKQMAQFTFLAGLIGLPIAGPGATMILGKSSVKETGIFSIVGPLTNFGLSLLSFLLLILFPNSNIIPGVGQSLNWIFMLSIFINSVLAIFNLLPFGPLDGKKVLTWNKFVWISGIFINIPFLLFSYTVLFS
jgi:Zn-dependent protease